MKGGFTHHCAEYVPEGKGITVFSADRFFARGVSDALKGDLRIKDVVKRHPVSVLHFPDHRYLLAWSMKPVLPEGITLIAGNSRVRADLAGVLSPCRADIVDVRHSVRMLPCAAAAVDMRHMQQDTLPVTDIWLTMEEMAFMWGWISGRRLGGDRKRNSRLKKQVMKKVGADTDVSLLIRFRLIFLLNASACLLRGRIKRGENIQEQLSAWTRLTVRHHLSGAEQL